MSQPTQPDHTEQPAEAPDVEPEPAAQEPPAQEPAAEEPDAQAPAAAPTLRPSGPRPVPRPPARPQAAARAAAADKAPAQEPVAVAPSSDPAPWGRVDDDGTVYVKDPQDDSGERAVGSHPGATAAEALAYFGRKYDDLAAQVALAEQRLQTSGTAIKDVVRALAGVKEQLPTAAVVGDLAALVARVEALDAGIAERRKEAELARAADKEASRLVRLALVEEAEKISGTDPGRIQWKASGDRMQELFEEWKQSQRTGSRLDKPVEEELWRRFSHSRTAFDRARKHHFAQLHAEHGEVKAAKDTLIKEAEALSSSTDWAPTSIAYRALMDRWKAAGRAGRKDDDALWARFRAAQDAFFEARNADQAKQDEEFTANLEVKEALLQEAEKLVPVKNLDAAKSGLRDIQDRWEAAGKVPRGDVARVEKRMRAIEQAVRDVEDARWTRSNPETKARAEGALGQLEDSIATLERDLDAARAAGDSRAEKEATAALEARRAWLEQIRKAADDHA